MKYNCNDTHIYIYDAKNILQHQISIGAPVYTNTGIGLEILLKYTMDFSNNNTKNISPNCVNSKVSTYVTDMIVITETGDRVICNNVHIVS